MKRALVVLLCLACSTPALADEKLASKLFQRGAQAYKRGDFAEAAEAFEAAFEQSPRGPTMYNAALAWHEAGDKPRTAEALERAIEHGDLVDPQLEDARHRLEVLRRVLARIRVEAPGGDVSLGRVRGRAPPVTVYVRPGEHTAELSIDGQVFAENVTVSAGEQRTIELGPRPTEPSGRAPIPSDDTPKTSGASGSSQRTWGFVALGAGAAFAGLALVLGSQGLKARDEFDESNRTDADARDRAVTLKLWANIAWGVAIAGAGTGAVLLIDAPSEGGGTALVSVSGRF